MDVRATANGSSQQAVQGSGVQHNYFGVQAQTPDVSVVLLDDSGESLEPGRRRCYQLELTNRGNATRRLRLAADGLPSECVSFDPPVVDLVPGPTVLAALHVRPTDQQPTAGRREFSVVAIERPDAGPAVFWRSTTCSVAVARRPRVALDVGPLRDDGIGRVGVAVRNEGNCQVEGYLAVQPLDSGTTRALPPGSFSGDSGFAVSPQSRWAQVDLAFTPPPRSWRRQWYTAQVVAGDDRGVTLSAPRPIGLEVDGWLPRPPSLRGGGWRWPLAVVAGLAVGLGVAVLLFPPGSTRAPAATTVSVLQAAAQVRRPATLEEARAAVSDYLALMNAGAHDVAFERYRRGLDQTQHDCQMAWWREHVSSTDLLSVSPPDSGSVAFRVRVRFHTVRGGTSVELARWPVEHDPAGGYDIEGRSC